MYVETDRYFSELHVSVYLIIPSLHAHDSGVYMYIKQRLYMYAIIDIPNKLKLPSGDRNSNLEALEPLISVNTLRSIARIKDMYIHVYTYSYIGTNNRTGGTVHLQLARRVKVPTYQKTHTFYYGTSHFLNDRNFPLRVRSDWATTCTRGRP